MRALPRIETDVLVIGQGIAGLMCAWMLAQKDLDVAIVGRGTTASEMSTGCLSYPMEGKISSLLQLELDDEIWAGEMTEGLFSSMMDKARNPYFGARTNSVKVLSHNGLGLRTNLAPRFTFVSNEEEISGKRLGVLGIEEIGTVDSRLFARLASRTAQTEVQSKKVDLEALEGTDTDRSTPPFRSDEMVERIAAVLKEYDADMVFLPPLFSLDDHLSNLDRLEQMSGRELGEPATPISLPGQRMCRALERTVLGSGALSLSGRRLVQLRINDAGTMDALLTSGLRVQGISARKVIHCGGGIVRVGTSRIDPKGPVGTPGRRAFGRQEQIFQGR
jgi:anaerobic glycerol-3-phosphate dehydrogenase